MNSSASRYPDFTITQITDLTGTADRISTLARRMGRRGAAQQLRKVPVEAQPLLALQRLWLESKSVLCVCETVRAAQRYFCEATEGGAVSDLQAFLLHEQMPVYQRDFTLECLRGVREMLVECPVALFITESMYRQLLSEEDLALASFELLEMGNISRNDAQFSDDDPTVSCICLRRGPGGRWLLMDHEDAAIVNPAVVPDEELTGRLLRHVVSMSGRHLAPYIAMMFDVPHAWKANADLAACALLVFDGDEVVLGCQQRGIPERILWNDVLGIIAAE